MDLRPYVENKVSGVQGVSLELDMTVDLSAISTRTRNALIKAVSSGVLPAESGQVSWLYHFFRKQYNWHQPHVWGKGKWHGKRLWLTKEQKQQVEPYFLLQGYELVFRAWFGGNSSTGCYWQIAEGGQYHSADVPKDSKPDAVDKLLKSFDRRDKGIVDHIIKQIERGVVLKFKGEI